jgi:hypothetical protein
MTIATAKYPFSAKDGTPIPLDVVRPYGVLRKDFNSSTGTAAEALPADVEVLMIRATEDCFIKFANSAATKPVSATPSVLVEDLLYLQKNELQVVSPPALYYSIIGDATSGTVTLQLLETWASISLDTQISRI